MTIGENIKVTLLSGSLWNMAEHSLPLGEVLPGGQYTVGRHSWGGSLGHCNNIIKTVSL